MSTHEGAREVLDWRDHLEGLRQAMLAFVRYGDRAGMRAPVPTAPDWTVRRLVAHQGMVHRWASAQLTRPPGGAPDDDGDEVARWEQEGIDAPDPLEWLRDGAIEVAAAVAAAGERDDEAARARIFLADAGRPRDFWARRQCHETTIHAVDALAACLGRAPTAAETWIEPAVALDGIDEMLAGYLPRPRTGLRPAEPVTVGVESLDLPGAWLVELGPGQPVTTRVPAGSAEVAGADVRVRGSAVAVYLTLWNRGTEAQPDPADWSWAPAAVTWG
ncbi:maleylpyruvate isomerase N-terminal domain-containing protein [Nocardioides campestrisoli]|uniref:maleylpyruvate isomerase N-terminal domain-containing protein n=1 Tax=Nocardioides campestrisoli TaxID=2736757 RepID=UPI00163DA85E|nr:maleylpyruvate isomerase N-terminal domain-containing protein [Nocardioides campestrisoli]